jgi:hypothetical protein
MLVIYLYNLSTFPIIVVGFLPLPSILEPCTQWLKITFPLHYNYSSIFLSSVFSLLSNAFHSHSSLTTKFHSCRSKTLFSMFNYKTHIHTYTHCLSVLSRLHYLTLITLSFLSLIHHHYHKKWKGSYITHGTLQSYGIVYNISSQKNGQPLVLSSSSPFIQNCW